MAAVPNQNDGFRQAMLKSALDTIPQLTEENYSIWKDKMSALLKLRGVLTKLETDSVALTSDENAELSLLLISKIDSVTHNNVVTADNRDSATLLWKDIKDRFASSQSSNRARIFNEFLYIGFKEDAVEGFVTDIKVSIKKMVDVGIDLPKDILAYLILFKFPDTLQALKRQIMHSDKDLTVEFVCNHLTQFNNENRAETKEAGSSTQASLYSSKPNRQKGVSKIEKNGTSLRRCTTGWHNPNQESNHSADSCWHLHPEKAPEWWREAQAKWEAGKDAAKKSNFFMSLITLWINNGDIKSKIILDSGSSSHVFNDSRYFDCLDQGDFDVIKTGKEHADLPIKGMGRVVLQWGDKKIALEGCLYVPDIVINLISPGILDGKNCSVMANGGKFSVVKDGVNLFGGKISNNMYSVRNPDKVGSNVNYALFNSSVESLKETHEKFGHASLQRLDSLIDRRISSAEKANFECKSCILSKISKQPFKKESRPAKKVFERLHLDLIGPISPESKIKSNYILTVVDNYSGYLAGFPLTKKDNTADALINLLETEAKRLGYFPSLICSDGGGEFTGNRAERANRTIVESMRATFKSSRVPKNYWHEVVKSCCFALNQIPRKDQTKSPWEVVHSYSLPRNYLKPVGTPAVTLKMKRIKGQKFDEKGEEGLLLGFNAPLNSYRILGKSGNVIETKHVRFLKNSAEATQNSDDDFFFPEMDSTNIKSSGKLVEQERPINIESLSQEEKDSVDSEDSQSAAMAEEDIQEMLTQEQETPPEPHQQPSRSLRDRSQIKPPVRYGFHHYYEPNTFESAIRCADQKFWREAISKEVQSIESHQVWENFYDEPPNPLATTWVFRIKDNCHGDPIKYKGRLCVQGFDQIHGVDYNETFAPTGKVPTLRMLLLYSLHQNLQITQFDVQGAFLHAPLSEEVYIKTPKGVNRDSPYLKLRKALYGLKQAPKNWYETLVSWLESIGFHESNCDPCLYLCDDKISRIFFHVDDLVLVGPGNDFKNKFEKQFSNSASHEPNTILGMKFERIGHKILLSQPKHIEHGLEELGMQGCKSSNTPLTPNLKLKEATDEDHALFKKENVNYRSAIGLMNYIACHTRPDISFAVSSLARFSVKPGMTHWHEVQKVWKYIRSTKNLKLTLEVRSPNQLLEIYSDASWGNDPETWTSQSGYLCYLFGTLVSWNSSRQHSVTYSSTEAELNPLVDSFHEGTWLKALLADIWNIQLDAATHFIDNRDLNERLMMDDEEFKERYSNKHFIDNKGLDDKLKHFGSNPKTRHIDLKTKGLRQEVKSKNIKIILIRTFDMLADALTKPAPKSSILNLIQTVDPTFKPSKSLQTRGV